MSQHIKSMTAGQQDVIIPGPVRGACPPPTEIVCIDARKVFDFCFQEETLERCFLLDEAVTEIVDCNIETVTCQEVRMREPIDGRDGFFLVSLQIDLILRITLVIDDMEVVRLRRITFVKRVVLCAPTGTLINCEVTGTCICVLQDQTMPMGMVGEPIEGADGDPNICCTIQLCITVQSFANVKLLIPTFGVCVPAECRVGPAIGGCPPMPPAQCFQETVGTMVTGVQPITTTMIDPQRGCTGC